MRAHCAPDWQSATLLASVLPTALAVMKNLSFACLALLFTAVGQAKCVTDWHEITGNVSAADGNPIGKAIVEVSWSELGEKWNRRESTVADVSGSYRVSIPFSTFSRMEDRGDVCEGVLSEIKIQISAPGFMAYEAILSVTGKGTTANKSLQPIAPKDGAPAVR